MSQYERNDASPSKNDPLLRLELHSFSSYLPTSKNAAGIWGIGILLAIIACRFAFTDQTTPEQLYALGAILLWIINYTTVVMRLMIIPNNAFSEWWLTLPLPREKLVHARMLSWLPMGGCFAAAIWLIATVHNIMTAAATDSPLYAGADRIVGAALAYAVLYGAFTALTSFTPMLVMTAMRGWRQLLLLIFFALWMVPTGSLGALYIVQPDNPWLSSGRVWLYSIGALLLIPLVYRLCLRLIPRYGFDWMTGQRSWLSGSTLRASFYASRTKAQRTETRGFKSLYALERSVFQNISAIRWVRIVYGLIMLGMAVGGYFSLANDEWVEQIRAVIVAPGIFIVTMIILRLNLDIGKRRLEWMLIFPYSRLQIMLSRVLASWATSGIWLGGLAAAMIFGAAVRWLIDRPEHYGAHQAILSAVFMILLFVVYVVSSSLISLLSYGYGNREWLAYISVPVMIFSYGGPMLFNQFIMPDSLVQTGISETKWIGLALYAAIGLPLSWFAFVLASKGIATTLYSVQARQRKQGIRTFD